MSNGKRTVYIQVTKRSDASTLDVIKPRQRSAAEFKQAVPPDVKISLEFDQSRYVTHAIRGLINEGLLGAVLTGLMVLVFLRDWRSALIVITTIPFALLSAVVWLWATGQTINIMTLGGLALAVGVLVDEATVEIENIHSHMASGVSSARVGVDASRKPRRATARDALHPDRVRAVVLHGWRRTPALRAACTRRGFAMISSYVLSSTLVPVLVHLDDARRHIEAKFGDRRCAAVYGRYLGWVVRLRWPVVGIYTCRVRGSCCCVLVPRLGTEIFPLSNAQQFQLTAAGPDRHAMERTELIELQALDLIKQRSRPGQRRDQQRFHWRATRELSHQHDLSCGPADRRKP